MSCDEAFAWCSRFVSSSVWFSLNLLLFWVYIHFHWFIKFCQSLTSMHYWYCLIINGSMSYRSIWNPEWEWKVNSVCIAYCWLAPVNHISFIMIPPTTEYIDIQSNPPISGAYSESQRLETILLPIWKIVFRNKRFSSICSEKLGILSFSDSKICIQKIFITKWCTYSLVYACSIKMKNTFRSVRSCNAFWTTENKKLPV